MQGRTVIIKNGENVRFWSDPWLYDKPLKDIAPILYKLSENKLVSVAKVKREEVVMQFSRWLHGDLAAMWDKIWNDTVEFALSSDQDIITWKFEKNGKFSVKSLYDELTKNDSGIYQKRIWKGKIPPKIKIFLWLMSNDAILTKDNLIKRKWVGDSKCRFCDSEENLTHLFFQCPTAKVIWSIVAISIGANNIPANLTQCWKWCETWLPYGKKYHPCGVAAICWAIWKNRNKAWFEGKLIKNPLEIFCHACALMNFWTGLFATADKEQLEEGVATMLKIAKEILADQQRSTAPGQLMDCDEQHEGSEDSP